MVLIAREVLGLVLLEGDPLEKATDVLQKCTTSHAYVLLPSNAFETTL
jgi:hypothetical protein